MKILIKITSLTLLALGLQIDAAQYSPGIAGVTTTCGIFMRSGTLKISGPAAQQFKLTYGLDATEVCPYLSDINDIQTSISANFNAGTRLFNTAADAQDFANLVDTKSYLFSGNIFPLVGGQTYYQIATRQIENEVAERTAGEADREAALKQIATSLQPLTGIPVPPASLDTKRITKIATTVANIDAQEKEAREYLNTLTLAWNAAALPTATFENTPVSLLTRRGSVAYPANVYRDNLKKYVETTFARRLQMLFPVADPAMAALLTLIQDPATPLGTDLLNPVTTPAPTDYNATETEATGVINAMKNEITATDTALNTVALPAPAAGAPGVPTQLSAKTTYILTHMTGTVVSAKAAVSTALNGAMALAGYVPPAAVGTAAAVIDEVQLATDAATAITATNAQLTRVAALAAPVSFPFTAAQVTLPQRTTALLTHLSGQITATDAELVRVAGALVPAFTLPAGILQARATALLGHLSTGGGSASITAYLSPTLNDTLFTQLSTATAPALSFIDETRTNLGLAIAPIIKSHVKGRGSVAKNTAIDAENAAAATAFKAEKRSQLDAIVAGLNLDPAFSRVGATADDKVRAAITYLTSQLYQSYMWLQMTKELTSAAGAPLTFAAVPGVPAFNPADTAQNVALATQNRITALINAIKALNTQNAALTAAVATARTGAAGAETDPNVVTVTTEIQRLNALLTPCDAVRRAATSAAKLPLLTPAVTEMVAALTNLSNGVTLSPAAKADGTALATAIRTAIETATLAAAPANPAVGQLAAAQNALAAEQANVAAEQAKLAALAIDLAGEKDQVAQLTTQLRKMFPQTEVNQAVTRGQTTFAQALIASGPNATFGLPGLPAGFDLTALTADAPNATSTAFAVGEYLRNSLLAAAELKALAGLTTTPATMVDLMTQSAAAIRARFAAAPAAAAAAGPINPAIIAGHNASVNAIIDRFNQTPNPTLKKNFLTLMSSLNKAAAALNISNRAPGVNALTITVTNLDGTVIDIDTVIGAKGQPNPLQTTTQAAAA